MSVTSRVAKVSESLDKLEGRLEKFAESQKACKDNLHAL